MDRICNSCGGPVPPGGAVPLCPRCLLLPSLAGEEGDEEPARFEEGGDPIRIGPYQLGPVLGEGGFGVVYFAQQSHPIRRAVALKLIKPDVDSERIVARFEREKQILAHLDHPGIAKVFDGGRTPSGRPFFVMELIRGVPITEYCDRNRLPLDERLRLVIEVCAAVGHAHSRGIIHCDLKPGNVLITLVDGRPAPKVIDFGVSMALGMSEDAAHSAPARETEQIGTPLYMSPEQSGGGEWKIDGRSDVYGIGILLYELVVGTPPFDQAELEARHRRRDAESPEAPPGSVRLSRLGEALAEVAHRRRVAPSRLRRLVAGDLDSILRKALESDRSRRYPTPKALSEDLERYLSDEAVSAHPATFGYRARRFLHRTRVGWVALMLVLGSLLAFAVVRDLERQKIAVAFEQDSRDVAMSIQRTVDRNLQQLESLAAFFQALRESPDARQFRTFVAPYLARNEDIQALEWVPRVSLTALPDHRTEARRGFADYAVHPRTAEPLRDSVFPILLVEPLATNDAVVGFNLASEPARRSAILRAWDARTPAATPAIELVQGQLGFLVFFPVFETAPDGPLRGFAVCVFRIGTMVRSSLDYVTHSDIDLSLFDTMEPGRRLFPSAPRPSGTGWQREEVIRVADREWIAHTTPQPGYIAERSTWHATGILLGGLATAAAVSAYVGRRFDRWSR